MTYRLWLTGEILPGFDRDRVVDGLAGLFRSPPEKIETVLRAGGSPVQGTYDADAAIDLQGRLEQLGARTRLERVDADPDLGPAPTPPEPAPTTPEAQAAPQPAQPERADIHAQVNRRLRDAWPDDEPREPTEQDRIELFMGPGAEHLYEPCRRMRSGWRTRLRPTWAGGAVFSPFLWAMYRKMWAWASLIFIGEVLLPVVLITLGTKDGIPGEVAWLGIAMTVLSRVFWPIVLKWLYCRHARKKIILLNRLGPTAASDIEIATTGGPSRTSLFVGIVAMIVASMLAWNLVDTLYDATIGNRPIASLPVAEPPPSGQGSETPAQLSSVSERELAANSWVLTRSGLRSVGRRLNNWFSADGAGRAPDSLTMDDVVTILNLGPTERVDGWGRSVRYEAEGNAFRLVSAGADGLFGTADDVAYRRTLSR